MGFITNGITGGISGTVGNIVGSSWRGIPYIRSRPAKGRRRATAGQLAQRQKFATVMRFLQPLRPLLDQSFGQVAIGMTGLNSAVSYNLKNALTGVFPDYGIDYRQALVSRGDLPGAIAAHAATGAAPGTIDFSWVDNSGTGNALPTDRCLLVAYCPSMEAAIFDLHGAVRGDGAATLSVAAFEGQEVQAWVGFVNGNGREWSPSGYVGMVVV